MILSLLCGAVVGLSLGLTGGGGSIFAVPLLVYALGLDFRAAVALSLAIVGLTATYGAALQSRAGNVRWPTGLVLGLGGVLAAPLGAWVGAYLPERLSLVLFAALMAFIGIRMLRSRAGAGGNGAPVADLPFAWARCAPQPDDVPHFSWSCAGKLLVAGGVSGVLSGIFGVGGGFLIVPTLMVVARLSIQRALATSLVGIALIAGAGFAANARSLASEHLVLGAWFLLGSTLGMTGGAMLKSRIPAAHLNRIFAISVLAVAAFVLLRNLLG